MSCCGVSWVGVDRAHCCRRTGGCGHVFDDVRVWDAHRPGRRCVDPHSVGLVQTTTGIWLPTRERVPPAAGQRGHKNSLAAPGNALSSHEIVADNAGAARLGKTRYTQ